MVTDKSQRQESGLIAFPDPSIALPEPEQEPITNIFINWATRTPEHPAIIQDSRTWTYGELAASAQKIAQILHSHQVIKGETVAVSGFRSFGLIASMLGVLMSGAVLLNIAPNLPEARQKLMLTTAKTKYLLYIGTQPPEIDLSEPVVDIITINSDTGKQITSEFISETEEYIPITLLPDDSAYIFFTSGTTGTPKGVLGCHKGLSHFLNWQQQTFDIKPQDRAAQLTGLSFDVVLRDIFLPLTSGATLCLPSLEDDLTPGRILPWMERQQISLLHTVPTLALSWLMNVPPGVSLRSLRRVFFAGEPLTDTLIRKWREAFPETGEIINLYGPTETTLAKCYYRIPTDKILPGVQPVGSPLPQTQALVFTPNHQLCGIGELGEIVIRTPFRSKGYINGSVENLSKFVKNPFRDDDTDLLYYTGDRGRYSPDGKLEILGRIDDQVKIRGVRIEPGEISAALSQYPLIKACVVIAREDVPGDKKLVAYFVSDSDQISLNNELRQFLKQSLADYMVPSVFVRLESLPMTPNGKVDRRALPVPDYNKLVSSDSFVAANDELETELTKIWEKVLGFQPISIKDNFFELGGHSLIAIQMFGEIEKIYGKNLPLATLFQAQTIEDLATIIREKEWSAPSSSLILIQPGGEKPPLFCIHPVGGNILEYYGLRNYLSSDRPIYGLQSLGLDGKQPPLTIVEEMATHYIQEMRTVQGHGPYFLMGYSFGGLVAFEIAKQLDIQDEEVAFLGLLDTNSPTFEDVRPSLPVIMWVHLKNLWLLQPSEKLKYIVDRVKHRLQKIEYKDYLIQRGFPNMEVVTPHYFQVLECNFQAIKNYQAQPYLGTLTLFRCQVTSPESHHSLDFGWSDLVKKVEVCHVPGHHYQMFKEPNIKVISAKIQSYLDKK